MVKVMTNQILEDHPDVAKKMEKMHSQDPKKWARELSGTPPSSFRAPTRKWLPINDEQSLRRPCSSAGAPGPLPGPPVKCVVSPTFRSPDAG